MTPLQQQQLQASFLHSRFVSADAGGGVCTCVHPVVGFQLVLQAELLPAAVTFVGLLPGVDAFVALQRVLVSEAAPAELALVGVVAC